MFFQCYVCFRKVQIWNDMNDISNIKTINTIWLLWLFLICGTVPFSGCDCFLAVNDLFFVRGAMKSVLSCGWLAWTASHVHFCLPKSHPMDWKSQSIISSLSCAKRAPQCRIFRSSLQQCFFKSREKHVAFSLCSQFAMENLWKSVIFHRSIIDLSWPWLPYS